MKVRYLGVSNEYVKEDEVYWSEDFGDDTAICKVHYNGDSTHQFVWMPKNLFEVYVEPVVESGKHYGLTAREATEEAVKVTTPVSRMLLDGIKAAAELGKFQIEFNVRMSESEKANLIARGFDLQYNSVEMTYTVSWGQHRFNGKLI